MTLGALPVRHDPASAAVVRHQLAAELKRLRVDPRCIDDAILVASELVANAVRHAEPIAASRLTVTWDLEPDLEPAAVLIKVEDGSTRPPRRRAPDDRQPDGRGLAIVEALAADWGVAPTNSGKQVWARVPLH